VSEESNAAPLASFEAKWSAARPEFALARTFVDASTRDAQSAFACIVFELEHAAFGIREAQPAAIKLQWWAEEIQRVASGAPRHPLTIALGDRIGPLAGWHAAIVGAFAQRDAEPASDADAWLAHAERFFGPVGAIEATLFGGDAKAISRASSLARALRETAALPTALRDGKLPLPLDVLARHRLSRGDLSNASPARRAALGDWIGTLADAMDEVARRAPPFAAGPLRAAMAAADAVRARGAAKAPDPLVALDAALSRLSMRAVWRAWRAARRSRA
jgi:15-cis-phytoene synthase